MIGRVVVDAANVVGSGDDMIAELTGPGATVVTAGRERGERATGRGAEVVGPRWLLDRL